MSFTGPLILLAILLLSILLLVGLLPFGLRALSRRNRDNRRRLVMDTAVLDRSLLEAAERLRPFHQMKAVHFQEQREAVRSHLLQAREERRAIDGRLERLRLAQPPATGWPGEFFIRQPAHYVTIPLDWWHLWHAGRHAAAIRGSLEKAFAEQDRLHDLPQALRQAAAELAGQTLPALANALQGEKAAGLGLLEPLELRLQQLQQRTTTLAGDLQGGPPAEDRQTDELALELEAITTAAHELQEALATLNRRRLAVDERRRQSQSHKEALLQALPPNRTPENLAPILQHVDGLMEEAARRRAGQEFEQSEEALITADQFIELSRQLFRTGEELERLAEIQPVSPLAEQIGPVLNQWPPLIRQSHQLLQPDNDNLRAGTHALHQMAGRIQNQARQLLAEHQQLLNQLEAQADLALDNLVAAWDKVQAVVPLSGPDPLAQSYHALWPKREAARGVPQLLGEFSAEAGRLIQQIDAVRANLEDNRRYMQEVLGRLPAILHEAQKTAEDWLCLQRLAEQLAALRSSLESLAQRTLVAHTREEADERLAAFKEQVELLFRIQEELRAEAQEINRLDNMIRDHWQAIQENPTDVSEAKYNRAVKMTDTQYDRALSAERSKDARAALEKCLSYVEKLALN